MLPRRSTAAQPTDSRRPLPTPEELLARIAYYNEHLSATKRSAAGDQVIDLTDRASVQA